MRSRRRGFTLVEILLAVTIATLLMAAVLAMLGGIGRDRKRLATRTESNHRPAAAIELLRWDLTNAEMISPTADGVLLQGHGGIDPSSLEPNNRLVRVTYRIRRAGGTSDLFREQRYLDDPVRPQPWDDLVLRDVRRVAVAPSGNPKSPRVGVQLVRDAGTITEQLWVR
jgi:prepilin-type N-terminal cleavage/methylation domain-containing protein